MALLVARDVKKNFQGVQALAGVTLQVERGEFVSIIGASGSGKSTLLSILGGIEKPDAGAVLLDDQDITKWPEKELARLRRTRLGFVFQFFNLAPYLTVEENVLFPLILDGKRTKDYAKQLDELLVYLGIDKLRGRLPRKLSGGEQQRVAIARGLITNPEVILLDEPTGNLDSVNAHEIMQLLSRINRERATTIVQVTHSDANAAFADRILTMCDGRIVSERRLTHEGAPSAEAGEAAPSTPDAAPGAGAQGEQA